MPSWSFPAWHSKRYYDLTNLKKGGISLTRFPSYVINLITETRRMGLVRRDALRFSRQAHRHGGNYGQLKNMNCLFIDKSIYKFSSRCFESGNWCGNDLYYCNRITMQCLRSAELEHGCGRLQNSRGFSGVWQDAYPPLHNSRGFLGV